MNDKILADIVLKREKDNFLQGCNNELYVVAHYITRSEFTALASMLPCPLYLNSGLPCLEVVLSVFIQQT